MQLAEGPSLKSQMKMAAKSGVRDVIIIGEEEISKGEYQIKNLETGEQNSVNKDEFIQRLVKP